MVCRRVFIIKSMRKVQLKYFSPGVKNSIISANKLHSVFFGWGKKFYFSDKKLAAAFLRKLSKDLTSVAVELNYLTGEIYGYYRENYFYLAPDQELNVHFENIDFYFNMVFSPPGFRSEQVFYCVSNIYKIIDSLEAVLTALRAVSGRLNLHLQNKKYGAVALRLAALREFLRDFK